MIKPRLGKDVLIGKNVQFGEDVVIWNFVIIGDNTRIDDGTIISSFVDIGKNVSIGKNCSIQAHVTISNECKIGDNVFIGPNSSILNDKFPQNELLTPPIIENNVIIGGCSSILPNIKINANSVVAAGSTVTKDVAAETVVKGIPARYMMTKKEYQEKKLDFLKKKR